MIRYILEATWRDKIGRNKKQSIIGVYAKYYLSKNGYLSAGLNLSKTLKLGNNTDNVSINNTQILFGGYFDLIKR
jgi:hypothetical protein